MIGLAVSSGGSPAAGFTSCYEICAVQLPTMSRGGLGPNGDPAQFPALSKAAALGVAGSLGITGVQRQQAMGMGRRDRRMYLY